MKITFKCINGKYTVTVDKVEQTFPTSKEAWEFIFDTQKEVA